MGVRKIENVNIFHPLSNDDIIIFKNGSEFQLRQSGINWYVVEKNTWQTIPGYPLTGIFGMSELIYWLNQYNDSLTEAK